MFCSCRRCQQRWLRGPPRKGQSRISNFTFWRKGGWRAARDFAASGATGDRCVEATQRYELVFDADLFPAFRRGQAYLALRKPKEAIEFQKLVDLITAASFRLPAGALVLGAVRAGANHGWEHG